MNGIAVDHLQQLTPLGSLGPDALAQVLSLAKQEKLPRQFGKQPYAWPRQVVYLLHGQVKLDYPNGASKVLVGGAGEALSPLSVAGVTPTHLRAITDVELMCFEEDALDILITWDQLVPARADERAAAAATIAPVIAACPVSGEAAKLSALIDVHRLTLGTFASLPPAHIDSLLECFTPLPVKSGEVVVRQHAPGDFYYVIERGRAQVFREVAGARIELAELTSGDAFGEEALIAETSRNATVTMATDGLLLRLASADFIRLLREPLLHYLDAGQAREHVRAGACWLDVRFPAEYRHDGLPGALNIPLNELRDALPTLAKNREYIAYCQTGRRSSAAAFLLSQRGFCAGLLAGGLKSMRPLERVEQVEQVEQMKQEKQGEKGESMIQETLPA